MADSTLNASRREADLEALSDGAVVDVLVIGGGVTGAGVALDAASRGLSVALVERGDLAAGTSRWSSKLVHGGTRYLATGEVGLAVESARERGILMERTAPHLVRALPFLLPYNDDVPGRVAVLTAAGVWTGNALRAMAGTRRRTLPRPRRISAAATRLLHPAVRTADLRGALLSWEGQLIDDARLVIALARTAAAHGARIITYAEVDAIDGGVVRIVDHHSGGRHEVRARHVVNATGAWADRLDDAIELQPSKGAHLVVRASALGDPQAALAVRVPGSLNRFVFALPAGDGLCYIGLTDDALDGPVPDEPQATDVDAAFLLDVLGRGLAAPIDAGDVVGSFAGVRPLLRKVGAKADARAVTADLSRRHLLHEGEDGLLTITGGKLTTYRQMAADVVDRIAARPGVHARPCRTDRLPLIGAGNPLQLARVAAPARLVARYGLEAERVAALAGRDPALADPVADDVPTLGVEFAFGVLAEGALTPADLLERRTRVGLVPALRAAATPAAEAAFRAGAWAA